VTGEPTPDPIAEPPDTAPTDPAGALSSKRGLPPWAWVAIGLLAGALGAGAIAFAYVGGLSAGQRNAASSVQATQTVASVATALVDPDPATVPTQGTPPEEPPADPPPTTGSGANAVVQAPSKPPLKKKFPDSHKSVVIPTVWTGVMGAAGSGPWESGEFELKDGCVKLRLVVGNGTGKLGFVQLVEVKPIDWWGVLWSSDSITSVDVESAPILIGAGTYKIRHTIDGDWSLTVLQ
jgi:hypothetical protein